MARQIRRISKPAGLIVLVVALTTPALAGNCDNPYLPVGQGYTKTYALKNKATGTADQYTVSVDKVTANSFEAAYRYPDVSLTVPYTCTPAGLTTPRFGLGGGAGRSGSVTFTVTSSSGVVIPPPDRWKVGGVWTYTNQGSAAASGQTYAFKNEMTFQVVAQERVKVPAGTFDALKVVLTHKGEVGAGGRTQPLSNTFDQWYAAGVGLVRQEDKNSVHELVSFTR